MDHSNETLQWDIFCRVIDNFGDIGICWRLAADLASRGEQVRLWADDTSALAWMAPGGQLGVEVLSWTQSLGNGRLALLEAAPPDVLVEAFGCEIPAEFMFACSNHVSISGKPPIWINLEYLSAEPYAERNHTLLSPVRSGPAAGWNKWFFYPGFRSGTGGLLRENELTTRQQTFERGDWLRQHGIAAEGKTMVSMFCYEPLALPGLLQHLGSQQPDGRPVHLLVAEGRARRAVEAATRACTRPAPDISYLPMLTQIDFDHLLWACDLNFVRGEDSIVRAIWAGKPFVWQIYPQVDGVHNTKLNAFLDMMDAPPSLRDAHLHWNAATAESMDGGPEMDLPAWQSSSSRLKKRLTALPDLTTRLLEFAHKNR